MTTSADARVIASFTFIVVLLLGGWASMDNLIAGPSAPFPDSEVARLGIALVPFVATAVALQATNQTNPGWTRTLGGAATMLGVLACVGGVLYFIAYT
jgi:hypothetical protein